MNKKKISLTLFVGLSLLCILQGIYFYPHLPDQVASHFGLLGHPDVWSSTQFFISIYYCVIVLIVILFLGIIYGMGRIPEYLLNIPNKDYWLAKDHKQKTFDFMFYYLLWFGSATLLLLLDLFYQLFQVHLERISLLTHHFLSLGLYVGFTILWSIGLYVKFAKPR